MLSIYYLNTYLHNQLNKYLHFKIKYPLSKYTPHIHIPKSNIHIPKSNNYISNPIHLNQISIHQNHTLISTTYIPKYNTYISHPSITPYHPQNIYTTNSHQNNIYCFRNPTWKPKWSPTGQYFKYNIHIYTYTTNPSPKHLHTPTQPFNNNNPHQ